MNATDEAIMKRLTGIADRLRARALACKEQAQTYEKTNALRSTYLYMEGSIYYAIATDILAELLGT